MSYIIGIDLGTTNSCVAYYDDGKVKIIPNSRGNRVTPSVVAFDDKDNIFIGEDAKNQVGTNFSKIVTNIKRAIGTKDEIVVGKKRYFSETITSYILSKIKKDAERHLNQKITDAVITVPAYFTDSQRQATIDAGILAGLNVVRIINEPTAASLAYGLNLKDNQKVVVYDLGGGTFDVSVLELEDGIFEVKATKGNNKLGGIDFDKKLTDLIVKNFVDEHGIDLSKDRLAYHKIVGESEKAKQILSDINEVDINIPFITANQDGIKDLSLTITRGQFEMLIEEYIDETISLMEDAISEAGFTKDDISEVILVGGSTKIPLITDKIERYIGKKVFKEVNPNEVVATGAAIQGAILQAKIKGVVLVDVTPLSLGIEINRGLFVPVITRNSPIPTEAKKVFTTISDNQDEVEIHILQGEGEYVSDNTSLGKFILSGIRRAKKGEPRIEVCFDIDANSILKVSAVDLDTKESQKVIINSKINLTDTQISQLLNERSQNNKDDNEEYLNKLKKDAKILITNISKVISQTSVDKRFEDEIDMVIMQINNAIDEKNFFSLEKNYSILKDFYKECVNEIGDITDSIVRDTIFLN